uniref:Flap endonuclease n=1 Tax=Marseillevirus LCMAC102 TaxID=2506603 RepID=A0A481YTJ2_9VIRU|nr:MAG: flap endonuclease [Marseillevirus LCMAC102]
MGIKDLYSVINAAAPNALQVYHLSEFTGMRFAIDISVFLYKYIRSAGPDRWMNTFILLLCTLKRYGIKSVCIFDGPNSPPEKKIEQERRRAESERSINRLKECIRVRDTLQDNSNEPLDFQLKTECRQLICVKRGTVDITNYDDVNDVVDSLNVTIEKLERQTLPITDSHREMATNIVKMLGLACFQADGEAETLCAYLAITGQVDAVLTEDTDVLAYGTPIMLAFKDFKLNEEKLFGIQFPSLLKEMEMNIDEFRDLCILLSCDYNNRVKGFPPDGKNRKKAIGIGAKGALCMIQEYKRLEEVCNHVENAEPLKYRRCRELFTVPRSIPYVIVPYNDPPDFDKLAKFIRENGLTVNLEYIGKCWKPATLNFIESESDDDVGSQ